MKVLILAGGFGTRLSEETGLKPKPMVEIGGHPILWHIMKFYSFYGFNEFIILTGYMGHVIKEYFLNYYARYSDLTIDMQNNEVQIHNINSEPWKVTLLYTGLNVMTGARILKAKKFIDDTFLLTYGDGLSDVDINETIRFHRAHKKTLTMTSILPQGRFGALEIDDKTDAIKSFQEKPKTEMGGGWLDKWWLLCLRAKDI